MASSHLPVLFLFLASICILSLCQVGRAAYSEPEVPLAALQPDHCKCDNDPSQDSLVKELDRMKTQLAALEWSLLDKDLALKDKDKTIASLQDELEVLQSKDGGVLEAHLKNAHAKLEELEVKFAKLGESLKKKELELQQFKERDQSQEAKERELFSESKKIYGHLIPPWAANRIAKLQASATTHWASHGEPLLNKIVDKASKKVAAVEKWSKPRFEMITHMKQKWSPVLRQHWENLSGKAAPHMDTIKHKTAEGYEALKAILSPQVTKTQAVIEPYVQAAREVSRPYVEKLAVVVRPHFERLQINLRPYMEKAAQSYKDYLISVTKYHHQLQSRVREIMKKNEAPSPLASKELRWTLTSALLILPIFGILLLFSPSFGGKRVSKPPLKSTSSHGHRKTKRSKQVDK